MTFSLWHIVKKDFRLAWPYLAVWWGLLLFKAYLILLGMSEVLHPTPLADHVSAPEDMRTFYMRFLSYVPAYLMILIYLLPILLGYVVSLVLKADSPIDERALWRTRPVARRAMLRAKLVFLGLFGVLVPCLIETVVRLRLGFDLGECLRGFVETALIEAVWIGVVASAALLFRRTITGMLVYIAVALAGLCAYYFPVLVFKSDHGFWPEFIPTPHPGYLGIGTGFVFCALAVATVLVVARQMYSGAAQLRGAKTLVGGWALAGGVALLCRLLFFTEHNITYPSDDTLKLALQVFPADKKSAIPLNAHTTANGTVLSYNESSDDIEAIYGQVTTQSFPALKDEVVRLKRLHSSLYWPDAKDHPVQDFFPDLSENSLWLNSPVPLAAAGYGRLAWDPRDGGYALPLSLLNEQDIHRAQTEAAHWSGVLDCESGHLVPVADVLPREGTRWREGNIGFVFHEWIDLAVDRTFPDDPDVNVSFMETGPVNYLLASPAPTDQMQHLFLLYNPRTKECIETEAFTPGYRSEPVPFFSIFYDTQQSLNFDFGQKLDENGQPLAKTMTDAEIRAWMADAHLIELRFEPDRRFSCTLTIDPFVVPKDDAAGVTVKPY